MKICIDPGHGGKDPGALGTYNQINLMEKEITLNIGLFLESELIKLGHVVYLTRRVDRTLSLNARTKFANRKDVDLFISIHCNSAATNNAEGIETWIYPFSNSTKPYASAVQNKLVGSFPEHKNRGVKEANFHVLRETKMPAILVETEFINNPKQAKFLSNENNQMSIAAAIAQGL